MNKIQTDGGGPVWHTHVEIDQDSASDDPSGNVFLVEEDAGQVDWIVPAILTAIFCFLPTGIVAILNAKKAQKFRDVDPAKVRVYTGRARFFVFLSCIAGVIVYGAVIGVVHSIKKLGTS